MVPIPWPASCGSLCSPGHKHRNENVFIHIRAFLFSVFFNTHSKFLCNKLIKSAYIKMYAHSDSVLNFNDIFPHHHLFDLQSWYLNASRCHIYCLLSPSLKAVSHLLWCHDRSLRSECCHHEFCTMTSLKAAPFQNTSNDFRFTSPLNCPLSLFLKHPKQFHFN